MNRVLLNFTISLLVGFLLPNNMSLYLIVLLGLLILGIVHFCMYRRLVIISVLIGLIAGIFASYNVRKAEDLFLYKSINKSIKCTVNVDSVPVKTDNYVKFFGRLPEYNNEKVLIYIYDFSEIKTNQQLKINKLNIKLPNQKLNFGGFDYRKYLTGKNVFFQGSVNGKDVEFISDLPLNPFRLSLKVNETICNKIDEKFSDKSAGLFKGILLGDKSDLQEDALDEFRDSGLSHVLAVSGLHLTLITMLIGLLLKRTPRYIKIPILSVAIISFVFITGFSASVLRASIMLLMIYISDLIYAESDTLTNISLAALLIFILNPNSLFDTGFILSFSATIGIVTLYKPINGLLSDKIPGYFRDCFSLSVGAQIGALPFMVLSFGKLTTMAFISNLLITVLLPFIYVLLGASFIVPVVIPATEFVAEIFYKWAKLCSVIPGQVLHVPVNVFVVSGLFVITGFSVFNSLFKNKKIPVAGVCAGILITLFSSFLEIVPPDNTTITFLNVGQADCALIETHDGNRFLVDCGTEYYGETEVVTYLNRNGVYNLDAIFISHFNSDHSGGLISILSEIETDAVYIPDTLDVGKHQYEMLMFAEKEDVNVITLGTGDTVEFSDINISVLSPGRGTEKDGENDSSLVLKVQNEDASVIFTGDIAQDQKLSDCDADILKVSHHGSKNGSTEEFLKKCTPELAVISLGENNMYGFPKQETIDKIKVYTDRIYRTDLNGTIKIICDDRKYEIRTLQGV